MHLTITTSLISLFLFSPLCILKKYHYICIGMKNLHYNAIVENLIANPEGLRIRAIARSIYNSEVDIFTPDAADRFKFIHKSVQQFLWTQSRNRHSPFERRRWGVYALKHKFVVQLELQFEDWEDDDIIIKPALPEKKHLAAEYMADMFEGLY